MPLKTMATLAASSHSLADVIRHGPEQSGVVPIAFNRGNGAWYACPPAAPGRSA